MIEAARLCARAEGGQILVAELVRAMAGRWVRLDYRPLGEIKLKGLPDPVATLALQWEPLEVVDPIAPVPLPGRLSVRPGLGVVGRQVELTAIADAFKRVAAGGGREVLLVSGEAGQGKTTLMAEAARAAFDEGALVLFGHSEEDLASPYQLVAEALGHYVTHVSDDQLPALSASTAPSWSGWSRPWPAGSPTSRHRRRPTPTPSASSSSPPCWPCWPRRRNTSRSSSSSTTCSGPTREACSSCAISRRRISPCPCSCSGTTGTTNCRTPTPFADTFWLRSTGRTGSHASS